MQHFHLCYRFRQNSFVSQRFFAGPDVHRAGQARLIPQRQVSPSRPVLIGPQALLRHLSAINRHGCTGDEARAFAAQPDNLRLSVRLILPISCTGSMISCAPVCIIPVRPVSGVFPAFLGLTADAPAGREARAGALHAGKSASGLSCNPAPR